MPARRFSVVLTPGSQMSRADIEAVIDAHNEGTGEHFEVVWDRGEAFARPAAKAHAFELPSLEGPTYDFGEMLGHKPAVISFWASWCAPCLVEAPHLQALHAELGAQVEIIGVSIDTPDKRRHLQATVAKLGLDYPVVLDSDGAVFARFHPGGSIPYTLVIDATGKVTYVSTNFEAGDEIGLRRAVEAVLPRP